jgi:hypothetical protein
LKGSYLRIHLVELFGIFEAIRATVRGILALEFEVATSLAWRIAITFDLSPLALIANYLISTL